MNVFTSVLEASLTAMTTMSPVLYPEEAGPLIAHRGHSLVNPCTQCQRLREVRHEELESSTLSGQIEDDHLPV